MGGPCHDKHACPAGQHESFYWEKCGFCGREAQCVDCVAGPDARPLPRLSVQARQAYLHVAQLRYPRKGRARS